MFCSDLHFQFKVGDDRRIEKEVHDRDVVIQPPGRHVDVVFISVHQLRQIMSQRIGKNSVRIQQIIRQTARLGLRIEPISVKGLLPHGIEKMNHFAIVFAIARGSIGNIVLIIFRQVVETLNSVGVANGNVALVNKPRRATARFHYLFQLAFL